MYSSRYFKNEDPEKAFIILENFEQYYLSNNLNSFVFYLESLLIRMECLIKINGDIKEILAFKDRFHKLKTHENYNEIFKPKKEGMERHLRTVERELVQYKQAIK